jgi:homoserine kinase
MSGKTGIKVHAPASLSNFGAGSFIMSAALEAPGDELIATLDSSLRGRKNRKHPDSKKG